MPGSGAGPTDDVFWIRMQPRSLVSCFSATRPGSGPCVAQLLRLLGKLQMDAGQRLGLELGVSDTATAE
jgi:hypothetical protein